MARKPCSASSQMRTWPCFSASPITSRKAVDAVSYRYPFVDDAHVDGVAPKDWDGWSEYQGKEDVVRDAVAQLLRRAGDQVSIWNKGT